LKVFFIFLIIVISLPILKELVFSFWNYSRNVYLLDNNFEDAEKFIKYGYPEIKEISIHFLIVVTSILIFSLTFSEKIVKFAEAKRHTKVILIFGWTFLIFSIILIVSGVALNTYALPVALSNIHYIKSEGIISQDFYDPAFKALFSLLMGGYFFTIGIISIVFSGILSLFKR